MLNIAISTTFCMFEFSHDYSTMFPYHWLNVKSANYISGLSEGHLLCQCLQFTNNDTAMFPLLYASLC